ncbi:MAG: arginine--tRNA ligase [Verrucomicrobiae bacterium]|nr:arginine--tRNA ligase [Verrucomicrobiae bacterium]
MTDLRRLLSQALSSALDAACPDHPVAAPTVGPCQDPRFGDYQSNAAILAAAALKRPPRELAEAVVGALKAESLCAKVEVAGPGFINFHLLPFRIAALLSEMADDPCCGIPPAEKPKRIVVDFSSPNTAKAMHVGHIRSTFLGDALARIARAVGHEVITDNHLGDWGTQFGMLIHGYRRFLDREAEKKDPVTEFERLYRLVSAQAEAEASTREAARRELAALHAGDPENLRIWKEIADLSFTEFEKTYRRLGVRFDHHLGESFYNPQLPGVVEELCRLGIAEESEGAVCIFFRNDPALKDVAPMIVRKKDGAFLYATTDLATVRHRVREWKAEEMLYVTDARQQLHFKQVFSAAARWAAAPGNTLLPSLDARPPALRHIVFGTILGADKKPIKTRTGNPIKLTDLLDEAESRALGMIEERNPELTPSARPAAARAIGIGAVKYADLSQNRNLDYVFDWKKLLALQGNTAPYLIYAYVRIRSIFRQDGAAEAATEALETTSVLSHETELALAKKLIQFGDAVHSVLDDCRPHLLANYLYDLATRFSRFYEACPVLKAPEPERAARLFLCGLTARTLRRGLDLLGIETIEEM